MKIERSQLSSMDEPGGTRSGSHGGVHRCHKCSWPYPNPHPSAKHRRSHKKVCGTLEGYKLLPSSIASDEDDKVADFVGSQSNGKSVRFSGSGSMSNRSTDEVFSDAIPEFQDCALERDLSASLSFKDCSDADSFELLGYSSEGSQEQSPLVQHSILNLPHTSLDCQNNALNSSKESLHMPINDRNGSMKTLVPVKLEKEMDECALDVNTDQVSKIESYANGRAEITSAAVMTDVVKELRQECTGGLGANVAVSPEDTRRGDQETTSETASTSEQREGCSIRENSFQLKEEGDDILTSSKHITVLNEEQAEATSDILLVSGQKKVTVNCDKKSRSKDQSNNITAPRIDLIYPSSKSELSDQKETSIICQEKDLPVNIIQVRKEALPETDSASSFKSSARFHSDDDDHERVHALSVRDNIPAVENAEVIFGGHERVKFEEDNSRLEDEPTRTETKVVMVEEGGATENGRLESSEVEKGREVCSMKEQEDQEIQKIDSFESDSKVLSESNNASQEPKSIMQDGVATLDSREGSNEDDKAVDVLRTSISATWESTLDAKSLRSSAAADGAHLEKSVGVSSESNEVCLQSDLDKSFVKNQSHRSEADLPVESSNQEDSLEGNCGSSYAASTMDTESVVEKAKPLVRRDASPGHHSDKPDTFEEPSFMRWVQPSKATTEQAGWFPLLANVVNESPGRRKNEERIAKITNWSTKQQVPLKNLLGEAKTEASLKSAPPARSGENRALLATERNVVNGNRCQAITVGAILSSEAHVDESGAQEWSSPVRHSAAIKRERKRARPYWAQLVCCSASPVNY